MIHIPEHWRMVAEAIEHRNGRDIPEFRSRTWQSLLIDSTAEILDAIQRWSEVLLGAKAIENLGHQPFYDLARIDLPLILCEEHVRAFVRSEGKDPDALSADGDAMRTRRRGEILRRPIMQFFTTRNTIARMRTIADRLRAEADAAEYEELLGVCFVAMRSARTGFKFGWEATDGPVTCARRLAAAIAARESPPVSGNFRRLSKGRTATPAIADACWEFLKTRLAVRSISDRQKEEAAPNLGLSDGTGDSAAQGGRPSVRNGIRANVPARSGVRSLFNELIQNQDGPPVPSSEILAALGRSTRQRTYLAYHVTKSKNARLVIAERGGPTTHTTYTRKSVLLVLAANNWVDDLSDAERASIPGLPVRA